MTKEENVAIFRRYIAEILSIGASRYMLEKCRFHDILSIYREFHLFLVIYWHFIILSSIYRNNLGGQTFKNASGFSSWGLEPQPKGLVGNEPTVGASLPLDI